MGLTKFRKRLWKRIVEANRGSYDSPIIRKIELDGKAEREHNYPNHPARKK